MTPRCCVDPQGLENRLGPRVAHKGELADLIGAPRLFQLLFGLADACHFWRRIDHAGDHIIIHMARFARQNFGQRHALIFGLMRQHRANNRITNGIEPLDIGSEMVGFDKYALFGNRYPKGE